MSAPTPQKRRSLREVTFLTLKNAVSLMVGIALLVFLTIMVVGARRWYFALIASILLLVNYAVKHYVSLRYKWKACLYAIDFVLLLAETYFVGDQYISIMYVLFLSDFYFGGAQLRGAFVYTICSFAAYILCIYLAGDFPVGASDVVSFILTQLLLFIVVFLLVNMLVAVAKRNEKIQQSLKEITEREEKLREAYKSLEEVTILEERNRIAKRIHDTTGHSITTIIMQTEAAKLIIDKDPEEAKRVIASANLQAQSALKEMRESVRLISGEEVRFDLIAEIERAIEQTTENTGIVVRTRIDESVQVDVKTARFLYQALKEGLHNGIRHGGSTAFFFELSATGNALNFLLSDNGKGAENFAPQFGLKKMREEAEELGGSATFRTEKGEGFEIEICLPYIKAGTEKK